MIAWLDDLEPDACATLWEAAGVEAILAPGETGTWAMPLPWNETTADIEIESVDALNPQGLTIVGIKASYPGPSDGIVFVPGYPPDGVPSDPIENARMYVFGSQRAILQLLIGVRRTGPAPGTIEGLRVRYVAGGTRDETVFPWTLKATDAASRAEKQGTACGNHGDSGGSVFFDCVGRSGSSRDLQRLFSSVFAISYSGTSMTRIWRCLAMSRSTELA